MQKDSRSPFCSWQGSPWHSWCLGKQSQLFRHPAGHRWAAWSSRQVRGHPDYTISNGAALEAAQEEATLQTVYFPHHSLIKLSFQGCSRPNVHTSLFKLWLCDHIVTHWWLLTLLRALLTSGHSLRVFLAALPFSPAILLSGWTEEASQVLCKIGKMEKKSICQHQTTQRAAPQLSHTGLGGSPWVDGRARECSSLCAKKKKKSVTGKQRGAGLGDTSKKIRDFKKVLTFLQKAKGELREKESSCSFQLCYE